MSEERLLRIDAMLTEAITQNQVPGAVALVARHGKILYYKAFGMADTEAGRSLQRDDIFRIASQTMAITIRHLFTHTSGIGYGMIDDDNFRKICQKAGIIDAFTTEDRSIEENIKMLAKMPLHHEPGTKYTYSEGLDVLGYFIEIMSG